MNRNEIESLLEDFKPWQEIKSTQGLEDLTLLYLESVREDPDAIPNIGETVDYVKEAMFEDNLWGVALYFHEMYECLHLTLIHPQREIISGEAYAKSYTIAHAKAQIKMFGLLQHLAKKILGEKIPIKALALAAPYQLSEVAEVLGEKRIVWEHDSFSRYQGCVDRAKITENDFNNAVKFFEATGLEYGPRKNELLQAAAEISGLNIV